MKTEKYTIMAPVLHLGVVVELGEIELNAEQAERLLSLAVIKVKEDTEAEAQAKAEAEAKKKAEKELKQLRDKATKLGIEGVADKDIDTLVAEIAAVEQK